MVRSPLLDEILQVLYLISSVCFYLNRVVVTRNVHEHSDRPLLAPLRGLLNEREILAQKVVMLEELVLLVICLEEDVSLGSNLWVIELFCCRIFLLIHYRRETFGTAVVVLLDLELCVVGREEDLLELGQRGGSTKYFLGLRQGLEGVQAVDHVVVRFFESSVIRNELNKVGLVLALEGLEALALFRLDEYVERVKHAVHLLVSFCQVLLNADYIMRPGIVPACYHGSRLLLTEVVVVTALTERHLVGSAVEGDILLVGGAYQVARNGYHCLRGRILTHHIWRLDAAYSAETL